MFNNYGRIIGSVVRATSAGNMCEALEDCRDILDSRFANKTAFMEKLQKETKKQEKVYRYGIPSVKIMEKSFSNIFIYEDPIAYFMYSSFKINACTSYMELKAEISDIISLFENQLSNPRTGNLGIDEMMKLLEIVEHKYCLVDIATLDKKLEIYALNKSHRIYDSFLMTFKNMRTGKVLNRWALFSLSPCMDLFLCNKYHVFLHEIGHVVYNEMIDRIKKIPDFFKELAAIAGLLASDDEDRLQELFADLFSAASLHNTFYSAFNPFRQVLPAEVFDMFEAYFKVLAIHMNPKISILEKQALGSFFVPFEKKPASVLH